MLTEALGKLRQQLIDKGYNSRSTEEDRLLEELNQISNSNTLNESIRSGNFKSYGSSEKCPTCQRLL